MNFDQGMQVRGATQEKKEADYSGIKCKQSITVGATAAAAGVTYFSQCGSSKCCDSENDHSNWT